MPRITPISSVVLVLCVITTALCRVALAAPAAPVELTGSVALTAAGTREVTLAWTQPDTNVPITGFNIYRNNQYLTTVFAETYTGIIETDRTYTWQVAAFGGSPVEFSVLSQPIALPESAPDTKPPQIPQQLQGSVSDNNELNLQWMPSEDSPENATGVSGYNVYRNSRYFTTVFEPTLTTVIESDERSSWSVVAFDNSQNFSAQSEAVTVPSDTGSDSSSNATTDTTLDGTLDKGPLEMPVGLNGTANAALNTLTLTWSDGSAERISSGYNVYRDDQYTTTVFDTNYETSLSDGRESRWQIVAFDASGRFSTRSDTYIVDSPSYDTQSPPESPTGLTGGYVSNGDTATITLEWDEAIDNVGVTGYNVYENNQYITTVNDTLYTKQVSTDQVYSYAIVAFDNDGNFSALSERVTLPEGDNRPPYFEPSGNPQFYAGGTVELLVAPRDIDGDVPGLYTGGLPEGMQLRDNFDGTRTLVWQPLQPEVGDYAIQVFAIDAEDPSLQTEHTVTFSVVLPDDLSTIPNRAPGINLIDPHVLRTGDEVIMEVKGTDPNGTIPDLVLLNPPIGSTFTQHPEFPSVKVLTWQTDESDYGDHTLTFEAYDSADPTLQASMSVTLSVRDPADFQLPGIRLRQLAEQKGIQVGYASLLRYYTRPDNALYQSIVSEEFNLVTPENSMKWAYVNPRPGEFRFEAADRLMDFAAQHGMAVHGHTLVWYSSLPDWVQKSALEERESLMMSYIDTMTTRYPGVAIWDVVNEAFEDDGTFRNSVWFEAMGEEHIDRAFTHTRAKDPDAILIYNDYDIAWGGPKTEAVYTLLSNLLSRGIPVDGVGFQLHIDTDFTQFDEVRNTFERFAALGLSLYITELDVGIVGTGDESDQARIMGNIATLCVEQPACRALQLWGITDRYSWRRDLTPLPLTEDYQPKPAYEALQQALSDN